MCAWKFNPFTGKLDYYLASKVTEEIDYMEYLSDEDAQEAYISDGLDPVTFTIAVDAVSNSGGKGNQSVWSWNHVCSGSNRVLVVGISWYVGDPITSITYNGVPMTLAVQAVYTDPPFYASIYYLINPDAGEHSLSITFSSGSYGAAGAISFTGANTFSPIDQTAFSTAADSTGITTNITTGYANSYLIDDLHGWNGISGGAVNTGQTQEWLIQPPNQSSAGGSIKATTTAGLKSMGWRNFSPAREHVHAVVAIREGGAVPKLQCYSESTIKTQGLYSLKVVALGAYSLNKTLTRSVLPTIDLSDKLTIKFDVYASRTGSNIKIGLHDSGGTTTEITPNIESANVFQTITWDISGVPNSDKDAIDHIIITIVNADADNVFYLDNMFAE